MASYKQRIKEAHRSGHLFAHMFESKLETQGLNGQPFPLKNLFDVMARKKGAWYDNHYEHDFPVNKQYGIAGLATTALKAEYPISLYIADSNVGLLMDSAKPIIVHPSDGYTKVVTGPMSITEDEGATAESTGIQFTINENIYSLFKPVFDAQQLSPLTFPYVEMSKNMTAQFPRAEKGLQALWQCFSETGWSEDLEKRIGKGGMNEVNVAADLKDVCGIIVNKRYTKAKEYAQAVRAASDLKSYLLENYPDAFDASLPIISYELSRNLTKPGVRMIELDEKKIAAIINSGPSKE